MNSSVKSGHQHDSMARLRLPCRLAVTLALTLALCSLTPSASQADSRPTTLHMVAVGITNAKGLPLLKATAKDALDMAKWAHSQKGKLYGRVQVTPLTNESATRHNVLRQLSGLESRALRSDYVVFYVSCHGGRSQTGEYYFCAYDGHVMWSQVKAALRHVPGTKIVILDTCHAGATSENEQLIVLAACQAHQESHDGSTPAGNSIYTRFLLEGLHGKADFDRDGQVSLVEAAGYAAGKLKRLYEHQPAKKQQFSLWFKPKNVPTDLPLAKLAAGGFGPGTAPTLRSSPNTFTVRSQVADSK